MNGHPFERLIEALNRRIENPRAELPLSTSVAVAGARSKALFLGDRLAALHKILRQGRKAGVLFPLKVRGTSGKTLNMILCADEAGRQPIVLGTDRYDSPIYLAITARGTLRAVTLFGESRKLTPAELERFTPDELEGYLVNAVRQMSTSLEKIEPAITDDMRVITPLPSGGVTVQIVGAHPTFVTTP
jgi:hypothetical protein